MAACHARHGCGRQGIACDEEEKYSALLQVVMKGSGVWLGESGFSDAEVTV